MSSELMHKREGDVTWLTLNRPHKANALTPALVEALLEAVEKTSVDGTRLLVIQGTGAHFCAGFDFSDHEDASEGDLALRFIRIETLLQAIHHATCETLALSHGRVFGAGADLVVSCSTRIGTVDASYRMPGLRFGVVLGTRRLATRIGTDHAREMLVASRVLDAEEAVRIGFLTRLASRNDWPELVASACSRSEHLSAGATAALYQRTLPDTRAEDMAALAASVSHPGLKERIRDFRESESRARRES